MYMVHKTKLNHIQIVRFVHSLRTSAAINSKSARQLFLDYYVKEKNYNFVKSSPVVPFHDATVPFVNAGMNQGIFLNTQSAPFDKVANYQKCIRIGGKHNDLEAVGSDGYHHTFFEMLGNWTFKQCSREEQCRLAWHLLTEIYGINKHQLFVTYFGGNKKLNLPPDLECKETWKKLGMPSNRILPFGMAENFWEMGATGPCGPCTEIHYDHLRTPNRAQFVNKGLHELIELWNIVFIEYNRDSEGKILPLPHKHVDTGMGFERLVAVLQHRISNYDTDVFTYLFEAIFKNCNNIPQYKSVFGEHDWNRLNSNYRILADHARMVTISLADGMIPEENPKLRKVLRRAFHVSETVFKKPTGLLKELSNYVIDHLGIIYPELESNAKQIHQIIDYEDNVYQELCKSAIADWEKITREYPKLASLDILEMPGFVHAYRDIKAEIVQKMSPKFALKLYDTYGIDEQSIKKLCEALDIAFDLPGFQKEFESVKMRSKSETFIEPQLNALTDNSLSTDDSFKYLYKRTDSGYKFEPMQVKIERILQGNSNVSVVKGICDCALLLDKTNLFHEAGGQLNDEGCITFENGQFQVKQLRKCNNSILHIGNWLSEKELHVSSIGTLTLNESRRVCYMQNHTATHLVNALLKQLKGATCQKSSKITDKYLNLDVGIFSDKLTSNDLRLIESKLHAIIKDGIDVTVSETDSHKLFEKNVTLIPGEIYPDTNIRLIEVNWNDSLVSREPCCGTHVMNTKDIESFCFIRMKSLGRSTVSLHALTGKRALNAIRLGASILKDFHALEEDLKRIPSSASSFEDRISDLRQRLIFNLEEDNVIPFFVHQECTSSLERATLALKEISKKQFKESIDVEMKSAVETKILISEQENKFIVHYLHTSVSGEGVSLQKATNLVTDIPVLIISCADSIVKARCTVPETFRNEQFTAEKWMQVVGDVFKSSVQPPKGQNKDLVCNLKRKKINDIDWKNLLNQSLKAAELYAKKHL